MALENLTNCPICDSNKFALHSMVQDHAVSKENFNIVRCQKCDFLFTNPRPDKESIGSYYQSEDYISHSNKSNNPINIIYKIARIQTLRWKHNLIWKSKPKNLLDYGCGTGHFLVYCQQKNINVVGLEPDEKARTIAKSQLGSTIFSSPNDISETFDVITLWHVLEHVSDLNEVMQWLKHKVNKNGQLVLALPNPESYDANYFKEHWAAYDVPKHLYHFVKKSVHKLASKHGFCVQSIHPLKLDSYYVSLLSNKNKFDKLKPITSLINGFISNIYAKKDMNYSSLIYVLKPHDE